MTVIAVLFCLFSVLVTVVCAANYAGSHYQENDRTFSKRLLIDEDYHTIINRLNNLTNEVGALKNEGNALKNEVGTLKNAVLALKKENSVLKYPTVAFMVEKTKTLTGQNHHIYYDSIKLNIGDAYRLAHGNFVAPVKGLYLFSVTACSNDPHYIVLELTVNAAVEGKVLAGDANFSECTSKSFLVQLSLGDDVYVQHKTEGNYLYSNPSFGYPSFSGALLKVL